MTALPAHLVATPVLERIDGERSGTVLGAGATAAWVDLDGFVIAITTREVPLLPNAIALAAGSGALADAGSAGTARLLPGRVTLGHLQITWDPAFLPRWDPTVSIPTGVMRAAVGARGAALLRALRAGPGGTGGAGEAGGAGGTREPGGTEEAGGTGATGEPGGTEEAGGTGATGEPGGTEEAGGTGAVDNHLNHIPRSATLPHRGSAQPAGAEAHARVQKAEAHAQSREVEAHARVREAEARDWDQEAEAHAHVREQGPGQAPERVREQGPGQAPERPELVGDLMRELARVGVVTATDPEGAAGLTWLFRAVVERDPELATAAARALLGWGPGLTPEGDDLLAAVAGTLAVLGPAVGSPDPPWEPLLGVLGPLRGRTTALSATLLRLALERRMPEPAARLLDFSPAGERAWPAALARLERLGHGSGRAYAAGIAATTSLLANGAPTRR